MPLRNHPYSREWDEMLNHLLDNHKIVKRNNSSVKFDNDIEVCEDTGWASYGRPYNWRVIDLLPSRATAIRLRNEIKKHRTPEEWKLDKLKSKIMSGVDNKEKSGSPGNPKKPKQCNIKTGKMPVKRPGSKTTKGGIR